MEWGEWTPDLATFGRIALAMLLGGAIGLDRELAHRPAGPSPSPFSSCSCCGQCS